MVASDTVGHPPLPLSPPGAMETNHVTSEAVTGGGAKSAWLRIPSLQELDSITPGSEY